MNGVIAASLAAHGFTGSIDIIEGERGFVATMADDVDWDAILGALGKRYKVTENGYKIHACCRHSHVAVDQAIRLSEQHDLAADRVTRIRVRLNANSVKTLDDPNPASPYKAKFSIQFLVASALIHRHMGLDAFTDARLKDPAIRALMRRVEVAEDPQFTRDFPQRWTAEVAIETSDGRTLAGRADMPEGDPSNPVSPRRLEDKCRGLARQVIGEASAEELVRRLAKLPDVADVREMFPELGASAAALRAAAAA
jgi:2-methylcitrate dehydratase PrpD